MGESKRRKLVDLNYGRVKHISTVAVFLLFFSYLDLCLAKEIQEKVSFCKFKSYKPLFIVRRINAKFYTDETANLVRDWLSINGISEEVLKDFFFPLDGESEDTILINFLEPITHKQHKRPSVLIIVNKDITDQEFITESNRTVDQE